MANPYIIENTRVKETLNRQFKQTTLSVHRRDEENIKFEDLNKFTNKLLTKKKAGQNIQIKCMTAAGVFTYMGYNDEIINIMSKNEYLQGRVGDDAKFIDSISQFQIIISEINL